MASVALVTGASRGIGRAVCGELAGRGWQLVACCRSTGDVAAVAGALAASVEGEPDVVALDVTDPAAVETVAEHVHSRFGSLDLLVNVAGVMPGDGTVATGSPDDWQRTLDVNVTGPFLLSRALYPLLARARPGRVVNVTGGMGTFASGMEEGGVPAYRVSKAALNALTLTLAEEGRDDEVLAVAVDPGWVRTDMGGDDAPRGADEAAAEIVDVAELMARERVSGVLLRDGSPAPW